ncbi:ATP-grasp domain-containing protein [Bacillus thuringiensis]|uniref:ATP-grasp domain-containing protein n=1 Tax=Bacillus thuringiensis TaxID=1428 RepID=UPI000BF4A8AD|nr:ATP-grasp domain-containing protein [Bacillus thuringiensis]PES33320.1 hypothetical protein CN493_23935 [Bacillus thuringiensis]
MNQSSNKKHLLMIGGRTDLYQKAKKYDLYITLIQEKDWMSKQDYDLVDRVIHAPVDAPYLVDLACILHQHEPFDAVVSFLEAGLLNAAMIQDRLGILGNPLHPVEATRYKHKMREQMRLKNVPSIPYSIVAEADEVNSFGDKVGYPIILKSSRGSGSRKIYKLTGPHGTKEALYEIKKLYPNIDIIAEKFIEGKEISVEAFSWNGNHTVIALTDKLTTGEPYFVEIGHTIPAELPSDTLDKVKALTEKFLSAIEHQYGPSHTEIMIHHNQPYIIESHTRTGGSFIFEMVENVYGIDFFEETLKRIAGNESIEMEIKPRKGAASAVRHFVFPEGEVSMIQGIERAKKLPNITRCELTLEVGKSIKNFKNSDERYGYVLGTGDTVTQVLESIEQAMREIKVEIV